MTFIKAIGLGFKKYCNVQTVILVLGLALIVAGIWRLLGGSVGLIALGVMLIIVAVLINHDSYRWDILPKGKW